MWFEADPAWHLLDRGAEEGWTLMVDAGSGRATFTYEGALGHCGSAGITARLGLEPGTRIAGTEIILAAMIHGAVTEHAASVRRVVVA
ncbi:hypothetical protein [Demequina sediminis]|uniref:hypothetical protein n=1 Tax=Demequina sediminis TaxID=1930058 RepID=UPI00257229FC|nr:hypothetical protein [Demequina sediminis]